ncbi:hypothetical protein JXO59_07500, partial [candidate division KSB1 bacterium]|nr:hypothetical protein [candidate division KSB1 bacterium]
MKGLLFMKIRFPYLAISFFSGLVLSAMWILFIDKAAPIQAGPNRAIIYVARDGYCGGQNPCYENLQQAIDAAQSGDEILIASGAYTGVHTVGELTQLVYISKTVSLQGGFTVTNWITPYPEDNKTILDAQAQGTVLHITGDISPTIDNFYITGGDASEGGGIYVNQAKVNITNNRIYSNTASEKGGGIYLYQCNGNLSGNVIVSNTSKNGGGIYLVKSPATLDKNEIVSNTAQIWAGGLYLISSNATLVNNNISFNKSQGDAAGGMGLIESDAILTGNRIMYNDADLSGGAMYMNYSDAVLEKNVIANNGAHNGVFLWHSDASLNSNIFTRNN